MAFARAERAEKRAHGASHPSDAHLDDVLALAKKAATRYREITGRPLGITGEVGELEATRRLGLRPAEVLQEGL